MFNDVAIVCIFLRNRVSRFRQKNNPLTCRCIFSSPCSEKNEYECFIIRQPVNFFTKNDTPVNFSQIFSQTFPQNVTFSVKFSVKFPVSLQRKNTRASPFYHSFTILTFAKMWIFTFT